MEMDDGSIVDLYWQRDQEAIAQSNRKYGAYCYTIANRILKNEEDAEECVNDTWLGAWNAMPIHRPNFLAPFLGKITRRLAFSRWKAGRAEKRGGGELPLLLEELEECIPAVPGAGQVVEDRELEQMVNHFLYTLPERACYIFIRRYWYAESLAEIAARYGMGQGAVKSSLFRSREKLRKYLEKEGVLL